MWPPVGAVLEPPDEEPLRELPTVWAKEDLDERI
jgi:hypothetical protein